MSTLILIIALVYLKRKYFKWSKWDAHMLICSTNEKKIGFIVTKPISMLDDRKNVDNEDCFVV